MDLKSGVDEEGLEALRQKPAHIQRLLDELLAEQGNTCLWPGLEEGHSCGGSSPRLGSNDLVLQPTC